MPIVIIVESSWISYYCSSCGIYVGVENWFSNGGDCCACQIERIENEGKEF